MDHGDDPVMKMCEALTIVVKKDGEIDQLKRRIEELEKQVRETESRNRVWAAIRTIQERLEAVNLTERVENLERSQVQNERNPQENLQIREKVVLLERRQEENETESARIKADFAERVDLLENRQEASERIIQDCVEIPRLPQRVEQVEERLGEIASQQRAESDEKLAITTCTAVLSERMNSVEERLNLNEGTILLGGINNKKDNIDGMLILNRNESKWSTLSIKLPCKNAFGGAVCLNNEIYIFGGWRLKTKLYKLDRQMKWIELAAMNEARISIQSSCLVFQGCIWVFGGSNCSIALKTVEKYDPGFIPAQSISGRSSTEGKWCRMPEMKEARAAAVAGVVNGKIVVCGGCGGTVCLKSVECYDPTSEIWTPLADMPGPRAGHARISVGSCLTVFGGRDGETPLTSCWRFNFDVEEGLWNEMLPMKEPREYCSASLIGNEIFVIGGWDGKTCLKSVEIFDGRAWRDGPQLPSGLWGLSSVVISQSLANVLCQY